MEFIDTNLEEILTYLNKLESNTKPLWGSMSAQRMVEHLSDSIRIAIGENPQKLEITEDKIPSMLRFLESDKPMAKNIQVPFAKENEDLELAIDEFVDVFLLFDELYENNPNLTHVHPYYGPLDYKQWQKLNAKHLTHHFEQFGLISL